MTGRTLNSRAPADPGTVLQEPAAGCAPGRRAWLRGGVAWLMSGALVGRASEQPDSTPPPDAVKVSSWPSRVPMPRLEGSDLNGKLWRLQDLQGRAVMVNFWATWCEPCVHELPSLQRLADAYGADRLVVIAVNVKEPASRVSAFVRDQALTLPVVTDPDGRLTKRWDMRVFPATVLIGADGQPRQRLHGEVDWDSSASRRWVDALFKKRRR